MSQLGSLRWSFHTAQRRLGEIVRRALADGPQLIHHDTGDVVVLPITQYEQLAGASGSSLAEYLRASPLADADSERRRPLEAGALSARTPR